MYNAFHITIHVCKFAKCQWVKSSPSLDWSRKAYHAIIRQAWKYWTLEWSVYYFSWQYKCIVQKTGCENRGIINLWQEMLSWCNIKFSKLDVYERKFCIEINKENYKHQWKLGICYLTGLHSRLFCYLYIDFNLHEHICTYCKCLPAIHVIKNLSCELLLNSV